MWLRKTLQWRSSRVVVAVAVVVLLREVRMDGEVEAAMRRLVKKANFLLKVKVIPNDDYDDDDDATSS